MVGAVIYVRVSTKEQTENLSLPTQLRACEEYCRRQGYEVLERFHEEGESAKSTDLSLCTSSGTCGALGELDVPINQSLRNFYSVREANKPDPLVLQFRDNQRAGFCVDASAV